MSNYTSKIGVVQFFSSACSPVEFCHELQRLFFFSSSFFPLFFFFFARYFLQSRFLHRVEFCGGVPQLQKLRSICCAKKTVTKDSVQFSPLTDRVISGTWGTIQQRSSSSLFCRRPLWAVLARADMSTLWCCPSSMSSCWPWCRPPSKVSWRMVSERLYVVACDMPEPSKFPSLIKSTTS